MKNRIERILKYCEGEILDIGCLQHNLDNVNSEDWLHGVLCKHFSKVVGIDIADDVLELRRLGYEVYKADAEDFNLGRKFDTIVAGEIIEHLSNPGKFLECVKKHLKKGGKLIITTPNVFWVEYWVRKLFKKLKVNEQHTAWYDYTVLSQLVSRYDFEIKICEFIIEKYQPKTLIGYLWHNILFPFLSLILPKELVSETILVVLTHKQQRHEQQNNGVFK